MQGAPADLPIGNICMTGVQGTVPLEQYQARLAAGASQHGI
ncbi:hypothetical protein [Advenella sp. S44]|nr:hypothetical protein [Advenella sp. S44]